MDQTALLAPVPRIGPLIEPWRSRYDPSAAAGVPPHVSVMAPFLPSAQLTRDDLDNLRALLASRPPIVVELATVGMFEADEVLHLRPDPAEPFDALTRAVQQRFPQAEPYAGRHEEVVPHVTVGHRMPRPTARHAARSLMLALPVRVRVDVVQLWVTRTPAWQVAASFPLGTALGEAA